MRCLLGHVGVGAAPWAATLAVAATAVAQEPFYVPVGDLIPGEGCGCRNPGDAGGALVLVAAIGGVVGAAANARCVASETARIDERSGTDPSAVVSDLDVPAECRSTRVRGDEALARRTC